MIHLREKRKGVPISKRLDTPPTNHCRQSTRIVRDWVRQQMRQKDFVTKIAARAMSRSGNVPPSCAVARRGG